ncbi:unnamed protein product [Ilex paraguariensis]|uniref:Uncharacterized protein n=1 Tax=Ilex paraguariensis TaxID=185542 RepID=A0ABC8U7Z7_9AQUA
MFGTVQGAEGRVDGRRRRLGSGGGAGNEEVDVSKSGLGWFRKVMGGLLPSWALGVEGLGWWVKARVKHSRLAIEKVPPKVETDEFHQPWSYPGSDTTVKYPVTK